MIHELEADSIFLEFGAKKILSDIYIKCETGKITGLLGRNGNGKSSLMNIIYGNLGANSKSVRFDGQPVACAYQRPELLLYLPQFNFIPDGLTLKRIFLDFNLEYAPFEDLFPEFRLKYNFPLRKLSGGQKRLIELYIVLKSPSQFAMLDEPFSHLSPVMVEQVKTLLTAEKEHKGLLITDHMYREVISISDGLYVLSGGKTHLTKSPEDIEFLGYAKF